MNPETGIILPTTRWMTLVPPTKPIGLVYMPHLQTMGLVSPGTDINYWHSQRILCELNRWILILSSIVPKKRPLSSMVPTIIENNGKVEMIVGASGGSAIITATIQTILNTIEYDMQLDKAIDTGRIHHQLLPNTVHSSISSLSLILIQKDIQVYLTIVCLFGFLDKGRRSRSLVCKGGTN